MATMHVICGLGYPQSKILATLTVAKGWLPSVTVTSDVIGQFYVRRFLGLELVLVMIRIGAKFWL